MATYKGRGIVKLDAVDLGNVPGLTLDISSQEFLRYGATPAAPEPTLDAIAQIPTRITLSLTITEYAIANLKALTGGDGTGGLVEILADLDQEYAITFDGVNCQTGNDFDFVGYRFVPLAVVNLGIIEDGLAAAELTGILLADGTKTGAGISKYGKFTVS